MREGVPPVLPRRNFQTIPPIVPSIPPGTHWAAGSVFAAGDTTSSALALDVNSLNATSLRTDGLLTLFTVTPVPEPSTVILFALGLSGLGLLAFYKALAVGTMSVVSPVDPRVMPLNCGVRSTTTRTWPQSVKGGAP